MQDKASETPKGNASASNGGGASKKPGVQLKPVPKPEIKRDYSEIDTPQKRPGAGGNNLEEGSDPGTSDGYYEYSAKFSLGDVEEESEYKANTEKPSKSKAPQNPDTLDGHDEDIADDDDEDDDEDDNDDEEDDDDSGGFSYSDQLEDDLHREIADGKGASLGDADTGYGFGEHGIDDDDDDSQSARRRNSSRQSHQSDEYSGGGYSGMPESEDVDDEDSDEDDGEAENPYDGSDDYGGGEYHDDEEGEEDGNDSGGDEKNKAGEQVVQTKRPDKKQKLSDTYKSKGKLEFHDVIAIWTLLTKSAVCKPIVAQANSAVREGLASISAGISYAIGIIKPSYFTQPITALLEIVDSTLFSVMSFFSGVPVKTIVLRVMNLPPVKALLIKGLELLEKEPTNMQNITGTGGASNKGGK